MKRKHIIYSFTTMLLLVAGTGCKKFLDVNKNVNSPTAVPVAFLLSQAERSLSGNVALGTGLGNTMGVYTHQLTGRVGADRYGAGSAGWEGLYGTITTLNVIIKQGTAENRLVYVGMAKIMKAYAFSVLVDIYGDCPFTEFDKFEEGIRQPKFDKGSDIYPKLFAMIDEGVADMNNTTVVNPSKPASDDYMYKGNTAMWVKAANTIKLKLYTQVRLVQDVKAQVTALLATPANLINSQAESFIMPYGPNGATDDRHPGYGDYNATQRGGQLFSPWLYEIMKGRNANILNGNPDPRIPYYIYNQKTATGASENCTEFRDGGFITILFGSNGPCRDGSNSATYSMLGIYPVGGRYDAGEGKSINANAGSISPVNAGTGAVPHAFISYADRLYLEAELINAGLAPGDQRAAFSKAMDESFAQIDYWIANYIKPGSAGAPQTVPAIVGTSATNLYKSNVLTAFDGATTAARKLEFIMTEKWINRIENPVDSWNDYRRTKYPVLFAPAPEGTVTSVTDYSSPTPKVTPVSNDKKYPWSLPFSTNEIALNSSSPPQKVAESYKVFWQP
jgi:hypothetical protein